MVALLTAWSIRKTSGASGPPRGSYAVLAGVKMGTGNRRSTASDGKSKFSS